MDDIDPSTYGLAIEAMTYSNFEAFGQILLSESLGVQFEPTGGSKDDGQDGFVRAKVGKPNQYIQISKEKDVRGKVRRTIAALRKNDRTVDTLTFLTSENFPTRDAFEVEIEKETGVQLRVHDRSWIAVQLTKDASLRQIFQERCSETIKQVEAIASTAIQAYSKAERMSVIVYMDAHARSEPQETDLLVLAVDAAIYKSLEGTDPNTETFRTADEIKEFVEKSFPAVRRRSGFNLDERIQRLSAKENNPRIRRHPGERYCLPHEVRDELSQENEAARRLELEFIESLRDRAKRADDRLEPAEVETVAGAAFKALAQTFEQQGLNLAASFSDEQVYEEVRTFDFVRAAIPVDKTDNTKAQQLAELCARSLREVIYSGTAIEREYLFKLFKLFSVEFVTRGDDRVAAFFRNSLRTLRLVVGTDILLRALSEACIRPEAQAMQNMLRYLNKAGAQLFLSELVLDELYTHIIAENREFDGQYREWYQFADIEELRQCDRILMRAFFYSNKEPDRHEVNVRSWENFLDLIGDHSWFKERGSREYFATFLLNKFGLTFLSQAEIADGVPGADVARLKNKIVEHRSSAGRDVLAENDAKHALYVNKHRERNSEGMTGSVYGYATWWMMEEFQVIAAAKSLGLPARFAVHPQFLMNFCVVSPNLRTLTEEFKPFFPTNFGMRITERVSATTLRKFIQAAKDAGAQEEAVAKARIRGLGEQLRAAFYPGEGR